MGLFGSSSKSSTVNESQDISGGAQDEAINVSAGGNVNYTDGNAIQNSFDLAMTALNNQQKTAEGALGLNASSLVFAEKVKNPLGDNVKKLGLYFAVATVIIFVAATQFTKK